MSPAFFDESKKTLAATWEPADIPTLCKLLGVSWERVEAEQIPSPYDCGQIDSGTYRVVDLIGYLLGAKDAGRMRVGFYLRNSSDAGRFLSWEFPSDGQGSNLGIPK